MHLFNNSQIVNDSQICKWDMDYMFDQHKQTQHIQFLFLEQQIMC